MKKYLQSKKEKIWATISLVWALFFYGMLMTGYNKDPQAFFMTILPVLIGWGVYIIWYDDIKNKNFNFVKKKRTKELKSTKDKPMSKWVEWGTIILAIIFSRLFGLLGFAAVAAGYGIYYLLDKEYNKFISVTAGIITGLATYLIVVALIFS